MDEVRQLWKSTDCVCLDVDSTVILHEGIDMLAEFLGKGTEVANIIYNSNKLCNFVDYIMYAAGQYSTAGAMQGKTSYFTSLHARLNIIRPSRSAVQKFVAKHLPEFTPNVETLVTKLHEKRVPVYLISGGFRCILEPIANHLSIPMTNVFANRLLFDSTGEYAGFDEEEATCRDDGKAVVIQRLKDQFAYQRVIHVGDGVTDLEACPPADAFIGFGGNQVRDRVKNEALWFVTDFTELITALS